MLAGGAKWAVERGLGRAEDLDRIEEVDALKARIPRRSPDHAKKASTPRDAGTLGSGNHYLEVQEIVEIFDPKIAAGYGLRARQSAP